MSFYTLALSSSSHDSCICLLEDSKVLFAYPCERTTRQKHTCKIQQHDIEHIKKYTNKVNLVVLVNVRDNNNNPNSPAYVKHEPNVNGFAVSTHVMLLTKMLQKAKIQTGQIVVDNSNHHLYHAAAGFYQSGFEEANCIIIDGVGTGWVWADCNLSETTTIFKADQNLRTLFKHLFYMQHGLGLTGWSYTKTQNAKQFFKYPVQISSHVDIGKMYGTITRHIGFPSSNEAGKTMGLSAYGKPNNLPPMLIPGTTHSDANFFRNDSQVDTITNPVLIDPSDEIKKDLAYNIQRALEDIFIKRVQQALDLNPSNNLVLGGGCALNILGNSIIKKTFPHLNVFIEPIACDASQALGAALYHYKHKFPNTKFKNIDTLYLGPEYSIVETKDKLYKLVEQYNNESSLPINSI